MIETPFEDLNDILSPYEEIAIVKISNRADKGFELKYINVHPKNRRQNVGNAIMEEICQWADDANKYIFLTALEIIENNHSGSSFDLDKWYEKHGFKKTSDNPDDNSHGINMIRHPNAT